jgi:peptidoglycan/LPS O-acetylase OafA/YrhL
LFGVDSFVSTVQITLPERQDQTLEAAPEAAPPVNFVRIGHVPEFDGIRGIAIVLVLFNHFWNPTGLHPIADSLSVVGWAGVDLFFVLSGFLITGILLDTCGEPRYFSNFYARRALRILPLYYLFLGFVFTAFPLAEGGDYFSTRFIQASGSPAWYLFFLTNFSETFGGHDVPPLIRPLWSLAIEEHFYLLFPLFVFWFPRRWVVALLAAAVGFALLFRTATLFAWPDNHHLQYLLTPSRIDAIAWGGLLSILARSVDAKKLAAPALLFLGVAVVALLLTIPLHEFDRRSPFLRTAGFSIIAVACASVVLCSHCFRGSGGTALLRFAPLRYVGKICFGLYVLHRLSEGILMRLIERYGSPESLGGVWLLIVKIAFAIVVASLSWYLFEQPILRWKRLFSYRLESRSLPTRNLGGA